MPVRHPKRDENTGASFEWVGKDKRLKKLQRELWDEGWWPEPKKKGIYWMHPDAGAGGVLMHGSESDHRAFENLKSEIKRTRDRAGAGEPAN